MNSISNPIGGHEKTDMSLLKRGQKARGGDCNSDRLGILSWAAIFDASRRRDEYRADLGVVSSRASLGSLRICRMSSAVIDFFDLAQRKLAGVAQNRKSLLFVLELFRIRSSSASENEYDY